MVDPKMWILDKESSEKINIRVRVTSIKFNLLKWWTRSDSNTRPPRCKRGALPTKLRAREISF